MPVTPSGLDDSAKSRPSKIKLRGYLDSDYFTINLRWKFQTGWQVVEELVLPYTTKDEWRKLSEWVETAKVGYTTSINTANHKKIDVTVEEID